jgi:hypothetical protein
MNGIKSDGKTNFSCCISTNGKKRFYQRFPFKFMFYSTVTREYEEEE